MSIAAVSACPCERCEAWHAEEVRNLQWKENLNRELPCPCSVTAAPNELNPPASGEFRRRVCWWGKDTQDTQASLVEGLLIHSGLVQRHSDSCQIKLGLLGKGE